MFEWVASFLWALLLFILGGVCSLSIALYYLIKLLSFAEDKVIKGRQEELKKHEVEREQINKESRNSTEIVQTKDLKVWLKIHTTLNNEQRELEYKLKKWEWGVLKANMLFLFPEEQSSTCSSIILLDGAEVAATFMKEKKNRPVWNLPHNEIVLKHHQRDLMPGNKKCFILFKTRRDFEAWYHYLKKATNLSTTKETPEEKQRKHYFKDLASKITHFTVDPNPDWITALASRIFWNIHSSEGFVQFLTKKISRKLSKVKLPSFVEAIKVVRVYFGPQMPVIRNVKLLSASEDGEIKLDADLKYNGEFTLSLEIDFVINVPYPKKTIRFPAVLAVSVEQVIGKMHLHFPAPPSNRLWYGFYEEPDVILNIDTEIGANSKIKNLPKLANIIVYKIKSEIIELMVLPQMDDIPIPNIKPEVPPTPTDTVAPLQNTQLIDTIKEQFDVILDDEKKGTETSVRNKDKHV